MTNKNVSVGTAPIAKKVPHVTPLHGQEIVDNYFWMRDKTDPDLMPHLQAENAYADAYMSDTTALQEQLYQEMRGRIKEADDTVPASRGRWLYFSRTEEGKQYSKTVRRRKTTGVEEVVLDQNELAAGHEYFAVGAMSVSPSGNFLAYSVDTKGFREYTLVVKNLRTGAILPVTAERVTSVVWAKDNRTLFYTVSDPVARRSHRVYRHKIGQKTHHLVFEEPNELFRIGLSKSISGKFIYLINSSHTTGTVSFLPTDKPTGKFKEIEPRVDNVEYSVEDDGKNFYILTNDEGAKDFRLVKTPVSRFRKKNWREIMPHRLGVLLSGAAVFADHLVVFERDNGLTRVRIEKLSTGEVHRVEFPDAVYEVSFGTNHEANTATVRLGYQSMVRPQTVFDYNMDTRTFTQLKVQEVKGYDASLYQSERIFATAPDGTKVPMSLVYKKDLKRDGSRPAHLYGYGSYGHSIPASFSVLRLSLLDRGFVFAIAHIRGGSELGEQWREDGKLRKKMNTFTDFIACSDHLVNEGYTSRDRLTIEGGSAGGLLMGAVLNLRPTVAKAAILAVPFVDVINTMLDESLPLTVGEFVEWGNPKVKEDYDYIRTYSPYENITGAVYPAMLLKTAIHDSQVPYWEASKFAAKHRELRTDNNPVLLKTMLEVGGHGGPSGRFDAMKDVAYNYAFLLKQVGDAGWKV